MTNETINYDEYVEQVRSLFKNNNEVLSSNLKKHLHLEDKGRLYGSLISALISKKIIEKVEGKTERLNGKPNYFYKLYGNTLKNNNGNHIIVDQFGTIHDCPQGVDPIEIVQDLLNKNFKLELNVYKKTGSYKAKIDIIENN